MFNRLIALVQRTINKHNTEVYLKSILNNEGSAGYWLIRAEKLTHETNYSLNLAQNRLETEIAQKYKLTSLWHGTTVLDINFAQLASYFVKKSILIETTRKTDEMLQKAFKDRQLMGAVMNSVVNYVKAGNDSKIIVDKVSTKLAEWDKSEDKLLIEYPSAGVHVTKVIYQMIIELDKNK